MCLACPCIIMNKFPMRRMIGYMRGYRLDGTPKLGAFYAPFQHRTCIRTSKRTVRTVHNTDLYVVFGVRTAL